MYETLQTSAVAAVDADLLAQTPTAVRDAGSALRERDGEVIRYLSRDERLHALAAHREIALDILRPALTELLPDAVWVEYDLDGGALPYQESWLVDPA